MRPERQSGPWCLGSVCAAAAHKVRRGVGGVGQAGWATLGGAAYVGGFVQRVDAVGGAIERAAQHGRAVPSHHRLRSRIDGAAIADGDGRKYVRKLTCVTPVSACHTRSVASREHERRNCVSADHETYRHCSASARLPLVD